jgi:hypothetical protein
VTTTFRYGSYHPIRRYQLGYLDVREPVWTEALSAGSTLTFKVTVPADPARAARVVQATLKNQSAVYVEADNGTIPWGGIVKRREWDPNTNTFTVTVVEWRSWLYNVLISPKRDLTGDNVYAFTNTDQLAIARSIVNTILYNGVVEGVPPITLGTQISGVNRTATFRGTNFATAGATIDSFAMLSNGFDWDLEFDRGSDGLPQLKFATYYPERGGQVPTLIFEVEPGNLDGLVEDGSATATRLWAIGEGPNAESLPYALDVAPDLKYGYRLRLDAAVKYQGIFNRTVLASYARAERNFRDVDLDVMSFTTTMDAPGVMTYQKGDRGRLRYKDRVYSIDLPSVRVLEKQVSPESNQVKVTVDLSDLSPTEVDSGGSV